MEIEKEERGGAIAIQKTGKATINMKKIVKLNIYLILPDTLLLKKKTTQSEYEIDGIKK